ncbi:MAG: hypothetical protein ACTH8F_00215 [Microbacterium sp.]|uniref:hypothetical protein n=1 Tax=Microbacterium sp. TaxID=51671 RepID=UPI003F9BC078
MPRRNDKRRLVLPLALALVLVPGCSGMPPAPVVTPTHIDLGGEWSEDVGNGVTLLGTEDARATVIRSMRSADGVTMRGVFVDADNRLLTMSVSGRRGAVEAEFTVDDESTHVTLIDGIAYVLPPPSSPGEQEAGVYSCLGVDDPVVTRWRTLLDPVQTVAEFTADASAIAAADDESANFVLGGEGALGTLTISSDGEPLPIRLVRADTAGTMDVSFDDWGEHDVVPPSPLAEGC